MRRDAGDNVGQVLGRIDAGPLARDDEREQHRAELTRGVCGYTANSITMENNLVDYNGGQFDSGGIPVGGVIKQNSATFSMTGNTICGNIDSNGNPYQSNFTIGGSNTVQTNCP